jgi:membrane protease YdiL (CAAX protease family)
MKEIKLLFARFKNKIEWQRVPVEAIHFKALENEIRFLIGYAIFYIISGYLLGLVILHFPIPLLGATQFVQDFWYSIVFKIFLLLVVPSIIYFVAWNYKVRDLLLGIRLSAGNVLAAILMTTIGFFLNASHLKLIQARINNFTDAPLRLAMGGVMPLFIAALPEELYFRGYLQTRLEKKFGRIAAILASCILFAAWHLPSRYLLSTGVEGQAGNWGQIILHTGLPVFIVSIILALHWSRYRNIVLLIITHWAIDILPSVSSYFKIQF